ncbi:MAG: hypothetical protein JWM05_1502 [Acidimicrobiales bacterium]|nr:hypothetical protein [Acidimicrobiales bacterium]
MHDRDTDRRAEAAADRRLVETWRTTGRRQFLKAGGLSLATAAVLAACGKDTTKIGESGTTALPSSSTTAPTPPTKARTETDKQTDLGQLRTATSLELLIVEVYNTVEQHLSTEAAQIGKRFFDQHTAHAADLQAATERQFGAKSVYKKRNDYLALKVVKPALAQLESDAKTAGSDATAVQASQQAFVRFLMSMEDTGASTYISGVGALSLADLRHLMGNLGSLSARRSATFGNTLGDDVPKTAFFSVENAVPIEAILK